MPEGAKKCQGVGQLMFAKGCELDCLVRFCKTHGKFEVIGVKDGCTVHKLGQHLDSDQTR